MNKKYWIIFIILVALIIRLPSLNNLFYSDENPWPYEAQDHSNYGFNFNIQRGHDDFMWTSPPLAPLVYRFFTWFIGVNEFTMRLVPLIIGLLNIFLTYTLARKLFGNKSAFYSVFLMTFSFWHVLSSFLIEHDSSIMMMFWLLFFNSFINFKEANNKKWLLICGLILGLALLTKLTGGLIIISLGIYLLIDKSLKTSFLICSKISLIGVLVFSVFPLLSYFFYPAYFENTLLHSSRLTLTPSLLSLLRIIVYLLLWATPLLSGLVFLSLIKYDARYKLFFCWILTVIGFYMFSKYIGAIDRYMAVMIPAMCIVGGDFLKNNFDIRRWKFFILLTSLFFIAFYTLNFVSSSWIEHNISSYIYNALTFNWNFVFQFHGGSGPGFMTSFIPLGFGIMLCIIFFIAHLFSRFNKNIFVSFLAISLAFNLFLVQAFAFNYPYPGIDDVRMDLVDYVKENLSLPVFSNDMNLAWYLNLTSDFYVIGDVYSDEDDEVKSIESRIKNNSSTLIIIDYPKHLKTDNIWKLSENCALKKSFGEENMKIGYVFLCQKS